MMLGAVTVPRSPTRVKNASGALIVPKRIFGRLRRNHTLREIPYKSAIKAA